MATHADAFEASLKYFNGDELATDVFVNKYALTDPNGNIEELTPEDMHHRLAREFARIESKYPNPMAEDEIFGMLHQFREVVPQGSPMAGIGNPYQIVSLSNCFVVPSPYDSYGGIMKADEEQVQIMKRRGGVGFDLSEIRPRGMATSNAAKTSDGIGVFMQRYSNSCREVAQNGRRGALMLTISVHHPEIRTFIEIKKNRKKVTGANISIRLSDEFMRAVKADGEYELRWPVKPKGQPKFSQMVRAKEIWDLIVDSAWDSAEPGILFWDTITKNCPADAYAHLGFQTISTNPCSELTLSAYDSCRLLLLNLWGFVRNPFTPQAYFDEARFAEVVQKSQRLMDDLVDMELECIDKILAKIASDEEPDEIKETEVRLWTRIRKACVNGRRTGLGHTALGDMLAGLNMRYGSPESIAMTERVYKLLAINSYKSSCIMAGERGAFPIFSHEAEKDHAFIQQVVNADPELLALYKAHGRRNIANTTTAPAGSVSCETQTTSGVEPVPFIATTRRRKLTGSGPEERVDFIDELGDKWQEYKVYHPKLAVWMQVTGDTNIEHSPYWQATCNDIDWVAGVDLQAAAQKWTCHAISKTVNLPADVSKEVVSQVYMRGWETGCKGLTVYREGSRSGVLLDASKEKPKETPKAEDFTSTHTGIPFVQRDAPKRPDELPCEINHAKVNGKPYTILVGIMDGKPYEIFGGHPIKDLPKKFSKGTIAKVSHGKSKPATYNLVVKNGEEEVFEDINAAFDNPTQGAFTRTLSTALRHGTPVQYLVEQLQKGEKDSDLFAFSRVIARVLKNFISDGAKSSGDKICASCHSEGLVYQEGCLRCVNCGSSKCS
jgi:ribonucleoside-diphosphate reductase alpha chain